MHKLVHKKALQFPSNTHVVLTLLPFLRALLLQGHGASAEEYALVVGKETMLSYWSRRHSDHTRWYEAAVLYLPGST